ncbi:MAG: beta/gamma crystallin family protein [Caulobacterales bacterium]|nr:beta/gamma crystallin family protein [Caulobacterales bacterium]
MTYFARLAAVAVGMFILAAPAMAAPPWQGAYDDLPDGSYQRSCRDLTAFNGRLYGRCQSPGGAFVDTELNFRSCPRGRVSNVRGQLQCEGYDDGPNWGGGGFGGAPGLIVYENPDYRGMRLEVSDSIPDLYGSGLDDQITSARVLRGSWQICTGRDFNGKCWVLDADNPNLKPLGANDNISSIRRLPGRGR